MRCTSLALLCIGLFATTAIGGMSVESLDTHLRGRTAPPTLSPATWGPGELEKWEALDETYNQPKPLASGKGGVVAGSTHASAIHAGRVALDRGGNAMDACLATAAAQVVKAAGSYVSFAGLIDVLYLDAATGRVHNINGVFNSFQGNDPSTFDDHLGATVLVPGFIRGLEKAAADHARFPLATLLEPAIYFAKEGMRLNRGVFGLLKAHQDQIMADPSARAAFVNPATGQLWQIGERMVQEDVAALLEGVASRGSGYMYEGSWAKEMVDRVNGQGANATIEELASYEATTPPVRTVVDGDKTSYVTGPPEPGVTEYGGDAMMHAINLLKVSREARPGTYHTDGENLFWCVYLIQFAVSISGMAAIIGDQKLGGVFPEINMAAPHRITEEGAKEQWDWLRADGNLKKVEERIWRSLDNELGGPHSDNIVAVDSDGNTCTINHSINTLPWGTQMWVQGVALPDAGKVNQVFLKTLKWNEGIRLTSPLQPAITVDQKGRVHSAIGTIGHSLMVTTPQMYVKLVEMGMDAEEATSSPFFFLNFKVPKTNGFPGSVITKAQGMQRARGLVSTVLQIEDDTQTASLWSYPSGISTKGGRVEGGASTFGNGYADSQG